MKANMGAAALHRQAGDSHVRTIELPSRTVILLAVLS
jgi:hypothetical protein